MPLSPAALLSNPASQLRPHGKVQSKAAVVVQRAGQVEADRPHRRDPAHADTDPGLEVRQCECVEGVDLIDEGRDPRFFGYGILLFGAGGNHVAPTYTGT